MPLPLSYRTKQTTNTAGTGTLTLATAPAAFRPIATATGSTQTTVGYVESLDGSNEWEIGIGVHNGANPGTLTRPTILANSLGTTSAISFSAGTKDVQIITFPGQRQVLGFSSTATADLADLGSILNFTGSAASTLNLPAAATVPLGAGYLVRNAGTAGAVLTIDGNSAELVGTAATILLFSGETVELFATGTGWMHTGLPSLALVASKTPTVSTAVDFVLPSGSLHFEVALDGVVLSSAGQLALRTSTDGGSNFDAGASDYGRSYIAVTSTSTVSGGNDAGSCMTLCAPGPVSNVIHGRCAIFRGDASVGARVTGCNPYSIDAGGSLPNTALFAGNRVATGAINAIRFLPTSGNFAASGSITLYARRL